MNIYSGQRISLPTPHFIIFYNGTVRKEEKLVLKLSNLYTVEEEHPWLELEVLMLNINIGHNSKLMEACRDLKEYAEYVDRVRVYSKSMKIGHAVDQAIDECINEGILKDFLSKNRAEVRKVSIYEYDVEKHMEMEREENFKAGYSSGFSEGHDSGFSEGRDSGLMEGLDAGEKRMGVLCGYLVAEGRADDVSKAVSDKSFREKLFVEYGLD